MVLPDDRVKVLDFGLAKLLHSQPADLGATALATEPITDPGLVVGTLPYMSPEQVQGKPVDHRSDIFSLGVILYEMTTGQRPFKGDTSALLLSSILKDTPPLASDVGAGVPRDLGRIIRHSLAKEPSQRYQTALDLRNELAELQQDLSSGSLQARAPALARRRARSVGMAAALAVVVAGAASYAVWRLMSPRGGSSAPLNVAFTQLTTQSGVEEYPTLSPDGKWVVYSGNQAGNADIYLQSVGGQNPINLTKDSPDEDTEPAFSPDGELIAFRSSRQGGGIFVMGRTGESVRRLADTGYNPAWSPDGAKIVYATDPCRGARAGANSELWTVLVATGEKQKIFAGDAVQPSWSPHGLRIAYWRVFSGEHVGQRDILTIPAGGGAPVAITSDAAVDWSPAWSPDGRFLFFASDRGGTMNLWRVPIDERTGATLGPPEPISAPASYAAHISASADGRSVAFTASSSSSTIQAASFDTATAEIRDKPSTVVGGSRPVSGPSPSPDGQWVAFYSLAPQLDIFVTRADGSGLRQLTNDKANDRNPTWSRDGSQIRFMSNRSGTNQIWSMNPDGSVVRPLTNYPGGMGTFGISTADGSKLLVGQTTGDKQFVIDPRVDFNAQTPGAVPGFVAPDVDFSVWSFSPDGTELAGTAGGAPTYRGALVIYSLASSTFTRLYESRTAVSPIFLNDGRRLLFQEASKIMLIDRLTHATRELLSVAPDTMDLRWSITRDNRTIYFIRQVEQSDIWLMRSK